MSVRDISRRRDADGRRSDLSSRQRPMVEALERRLLLAADPAGIFSGLDEFLGKFADAMDENVLAARLPLVGDALEGGVDFLREMQSCVADAYAALAALADRLYGQGGADELHGDGDDVMFGRDGDDWMSGGAGHDVMYGQGGVNTLLGGDGDDAMTGGDDRDYLIGGQGSDTIDGGGGSDAILGDEGPIVTELLDGSTARVLIVPGGRLRAEVGQIGAYRYVVTLVNADQGGDDVIHGGDGDDAIHAGAGSDTVFGGDGDDRLFGNAGDDALDGGDGRDTLIADTPDDRLVDWLGNYNLFVVPRRGRGGPTIVRGPSLAVQQFLLDLAEADGGADGLGETALVQLPSPSNAGRGRAKEPPRADTAA